MLKKIALPIIAIVAIMLLIAACGGDDDDAGDGGIGEEPTVSTADDGGGGEEPTVSLGEPAVPFAEGCQKSDETQFPGGPEVIIDTSKTYVATIKLAQGDIVLELFSDVPVTTNNFVFLACKGYYDGVTFHRVIPDFVAQGGDPTGSGSGGPGYSIPDEEDGDHGMDAGVISMAKSGPNTTGSQFFITYTPQTQLEPTFTVFGRVTEGMDVVQQITPRDPGTIPSPPPGDVIETITIEER